jgi:hypothetical protein
MRTTLAGIGAGIAATLLAASLYAAAYYYTAPWQTNETTGLVWASDTNAACIPSYYTPGTNGWMLMGLSAGVQRVWWSIGVTTNDWQVEAFPEPLAPIWGDTNLTGSIFLAIDTNAATEPTAVLPKFAGQLLLGQTAPGFPAVWFAAIVNTNGWLLLKEWNR